VVVALAVAGCQSPAQEARDAHDRAASWAATVEIAVEQWSVDVVPRHFVESTLVAADADLEREAARIRKKVGADAAAPLDLVRTMLPEIDAAVKQGDESAALRLASGLVASAPAYPRTAHLRTAERQ
jgi:hypothetical protein